MTPLQPDEVRTPRETREIALTPEALAQRYAVVKKRREELVEEEAQLAQNRAESERELAWLRGQLVETFGLRELVLPSKQRGRPPKTAPELPAKAPPQVEAKPEAPAPARMKPLSIDWRAKVKHPTQRAICAELAQRHSITPMQAYERLGGKLGIGLAGFNMALVRLVELGICAKTGRGVYVFQERNPRLQKNS